MGGAELALCGTLRSLCSSVSILNENLRNVCDFVVLGGWRHKTVHGGVDMSCRLAERSQTYRSTSWNTAG